MTSTVLRPTLEDCSVSSRSSADSGSRGSTRIPRQAGTVETLGAEIDARRMVLRYLPGRPPDPLHFSCERRGESSGATTH